MEYEFVIKLISNIYIIPNAQKGMWAAYDISLYIFNAHILSVLIE